MNDERDPALVQAYEQALYDVHLPGGDAVFSASREPAGNLAPLQGRPFAVVTAHNPDGRAAPDAQNVAASGRLEAEIRRQGWQYVAANGRDEERTHQEPSFAVFDLTEDRARQLGAHFAQDCVYYWDGRQGGLVWCT